MNKYEVEELATGRVHRYLIPSQLSVTQAAGGEADAFLDITNSVLPGMFLRHPRLVAKIYKTPEHESFVGDPHAQASTIKRLEEHQTKLVDMPRISHPYLVPHIGLLREHDFIRGIMLEYVPDSVPLLQFMDPAHRDKHVPSFNFLTDLILKIEEAKSACHALGIGLSDVNWMNILVQTVITRSGEKSAIPRIIDLDSASFGKYQSILYTMRLIDPHFCDPDANKPVLIKPRDLLADDYALLAMAVELLLGIGPWDGRYSPKDANDRILPSQRPLAGISIWNDQVQYPDPMIAMPLSHLPDEFSEHCLRVFEGGERLPFPAEILQEIQWEQCSDCGHYYSGHSGCPSCTVSVAVPMRKFMTIREVIEQVLAVPPIGAKIINWQIDSDAVRYVYALNGKLYREDGTIVGRESASGNETIVCFPNGTYVGRDKEVESYGDVQRFTQRVGTYMGQPVIGKFQDNLYWINSNGDLMRFGKFGAEKLNQKNMVPNNTNLAFGKRFGYIYYQSGSFTNAYVINSDGSLQPAAAPNLVSKEGRVVMGRISMVFSSNFMWFMWTQNHGNGELRNHCMVIDVAGRQVATTEASVNDFDHWLASLNGKTATSNILYSTRRDGSIVKLELVKTADENRFDIKVIDQIPEANKVIRSSDELSFTNKGIVAANSSGIRLLTVRSSK